MSWIWTAWLLVIAGSFAALEGWALATGRKTLSRYTSEITAFVPSERRHIERQRPLAAVLHDARRIVRVDGDAVHLRNRSRLRQRGRMADDNLAQDAGLTSQHVRPAPSVRA